MITIRELLADQQYRDFFVKVPQLPVPTHKPWRLFMLGNDNKWRSGLFDTYPSAFKAMKKLMPESVDASITCRSVQFPRPTRLVKIKGKFKVNPRTGERTQETRYIPWAFPYSEGDTEQHYWCGYCRRPTVFGKYRSHHALRSVNEIGLSIDSSLLRCSICGASENLVSLYA